MTISLRVAGTADAPATVANAAPAVGAGATADDLSVLSVVVKPYTATITTPTGWTKVTEWTNGTTASGVDVGSTKVAVFTRIGATAASTHAITTGSADTIVSQITTYAKTAAAWDVSAFQVGSDAANGTGYSATGVGGMGLLAGDWLYHAAGINSDLGTPTVLAMTYSGATLGTVNSRTTTATGTGNDSRLIVTDTAVSAATTQAGPPVFTYTNASSTSGSDIWLRLREVATPLGPVLAASQMILATTGITSLVSAPIQVNTGDVIVVKTVGADNASPTIGTPTNTGTALTWTSRVNLAVGSKTPLRIHTAVVVTSGAITVTQPFSGGTNPRSTVVERLTNATLAATPATNATTAGNSVGPSASITTTAANSVVTWASGDWGALAQGTIALRSSAVLEGTAGGDVATYTSYFAIQDVAAAGSVTIGMTTPAGAQNWHMGGIEVLAASAPPAVAVPITRRQPYTARRRAANW